MALEEVDETLQQQSKDSSPKNKGEAQVSAALQRNKKTLAFPQGRSDAYNSKGPVVLNSVEKMLHYKE